MTSTVANDPLSQGARGGVVTVLGQAVKLGVQMVSVVVLARLLSPEDFGVVAMAAVFVALGNLLRDFGMPTAALQSRSLSHQQASNMFWANAALGTVSAVLLVIATPLVVWFYGEDRLGAVIPVLAATLLISGLQAQIQVQLARSMRYFSLITTDVAAQIIGLIAAVALALTGFGYWALVAQAVTAAVVLLIARWAVARWLPSLPARGHETKALFLRGGHFGATQLLTFAASNVDTIAVGSHWGATQLGYYNRAFELLAAPISGVLGPLTNVIIPTANAVAAQGRSVHPLLLRLQFAVGVGLIWIFSTAASVAPVLIPFAFGSGWEPSVLIFQLLAVGGAFQTFSYVSYWSFIVHDQSKHLLYYNIVTKGLTVALVLSASPLGVPWVAGAYALSLALSWPINLIWLRRTAGQALWPFLANGLRLLVAGAMSFALTSVALAHVETPSVVVSILMYVIASTALFAAAIVAVPGGFRELRTSIGALAKLLRRPQRPLGST